MFTVVTGRFNSETLISNYEYRKRHEFNCIYCCPSKLSPKIQHNTLVFVIEMNNSTNMIEGIGLIKNKPETEKYYKVHLDGNTNRYIYIGNYFINRKTIEDYNPKLIQILEQILFKGKSHSKRGAGLTIIPEKVLKLDICKDTNIKKDIKEIFITTFTSENIENNQIEIKHEKEH
jgi:hypothetical protein